LRTNGSIDDYEDFSLEFQFKLDENEAALRHNPHSIDFQLMSMPAINFSVSYRKHCVVDTTSKLGAAKLSQSKQRATPNATSKSNFTVAYAIIAIIIASILIVLVYAYYTTRQRLTTNTGGLGVGGGGGGGTASTTAKNKLTKYESLSSSNNSKNNKVSSISTHNHHHQFYQRAIVKSSAEYCRDDGEGGGDGDDEYCGKAMRAKIMNGDGNVGGRGGFTKNVNGKKASRSSKQQQFSANKQDDCQQINETSNIYETG
jgi:hypothetical protein